MIVLLKNKSTYKHKILINIHLRHHIILHLYIILLNVK